MRALFTTGILAHEATLKRLLVLATRIGFMDRPSVSFGTGSPMGQWGTVGRQTPMRTATIPDDVGIVFEAFAPPSGPVDQLYERHIELDLQSLSFRERFLSGLRDSDDFANGLLAPEGVYGEVLGSKIRAALVNDPQLGSASLPTPDKIRSFWKVDTFETRRDTLAAILTDLSIKVTAALSVAASEDLPPITEDAVLASLLQDRINRGTNAAPASSQITSEIVRSVLPDELLAKLTVKDILEYRRATRDVYLAWEIDIAKLVERDGDTDFDGAASIAKRLIASDIRPSELTYQRELAAARDKLFGDLVKNVVDWKTPVISVATFGLGSLTASIASALMVAGVPAVVDYLATIRTAGRYFSMGYLLHLAKRAKRDL